MDGQGWFWCSNKQIIDLTSINNNETTISSDSRTWDENSTFLKLNYFTVEHQKLAEAVRHILIRMNWSFLSSFHSAYRFSRNIRKEKKRRTLQSFPDSFWISHYLPCFAPILVIAQDTWTLKRTDDKNEQEYVWSKKEIISLQKKIKKDIKILDSSWIYLHFSTATLRQVCFHPLQTDFHSSSVFIFPQTCIQLATVNTVDIISHVCGLSPCLRLSPSLKFRDHMISESAFIMSVGLLESSY